MSLLYRKILPKISLCTPCKRTYHVALTLSRLSSPYANVWKKTQPGRPARWSTIASGLGLGIAASLGSIIYCDPSSPTTSRPVSPVPAEPTKLDPNVEKSDSPLPGPPESILNIYELSFGTVAGICTGVFVKKGAKIIAFFVGGVFVLLQYFSSLAIIRVDWDQVSRRFENLFYVVDANGEKKPPTLLSLWRWLVHFVTADFQPRASFLAGLLLGLRIG